MSSNLKNAIRLLPIGNSEFPGFQASANALPLIEDDELVNLLEGASVSELGGLVEILAKKGGWTNQLERQPSYKKYFPNHRSYTRDIAAEIQKFGANTITTHFFRQGKGVRYAEIVNDVAKKLGVPPVGSTAATERRIQEKLLDLMWRDMTVGQRQQLLLEFDVTDKSLAIKSVAPAALIKAATVSGFGVYKMAVIIANAIARPLLGHGLPLAANAALTKGLSIFLGPVGWTIAGGLAIQAIGSEAYRVTVPCVLQVAVIRQASELRTQQKSKNPAPWIPITIVIALIFLALVLRRVHS